MSDGSDRPSSAGSQVSRPLYDQRDGYDGVWTRPGRGLVLDGYFFRLQYRSGDGKHLKKYTSTHWT